MREKGQADMRKVLELELTDSRESAAHAGAGEIHDSNIVVSIPINFPSNSGGPAVVGVHHVRSPAQLPQVISH
jgi:hypothetical protein